MNLVTQLNNLLEAVQLHLVDGLTLLAVMWGIQLLNVLLNNYLTILGVYPRRLLGLPGIILSPFIHGNFDHIFFNSVPLFVLFVFMLTYGSWVCTCATVTIILLSGFMLWCFGRSAMHVGASGLIMGYMGFILAESYFHQTTGAVVIGAVALYYFGFSLMSILPGEKNVSFEGHFFGLLAGVFASYYACIEPFATITALVFPLL